MSEEMKRMKRAFDAYGNAFTRAGEINEEAIAEYEAAQEKIVKQFIRDNYNERHADD